MEQTSVEWFVEEMFKQGYLNDKPLTVTNIEYFVKQAKQMELEQRKTDYRAGWNDNRSKDLNCEFYLTKHLTDSHKKTTDK
jgi:hypothetical protein